MRRSFTRRSATSSKGTAPSTTAPTSIPAWAVGSPQQRRELLRPALSAACMETTFHVSEARLHRYLAEADFRYNQRENLGFDDTGAPRSCWLAPRASASFTP